MPDKLSKRLNSVKKDSWTQKLNKIKEHIKRFDEEQRGSSSYKDEEILAYLNKILPTYWDVFHTHNTYRRVHGELQKREDTYDTLLPTYDIGIFLIGYSSIPITLSLAEIQPTEKIYFLYSKDTRDILDEIESRLRTMLNGLNPQLLDLVEETVLDNLVASALEINDPSDPVSTFKRIKEIIDSIDDVDNKRIALDLTGGKKTMLGGGYTAGAIWTSRWSEEAKKSVPFCDMYYVDSKEYDPSQGSPVPGTEFLSQLVNPYDVYNVQSNMQARKLFEKHNYEAAANLWEDVRNTLEKHASQYSLETEKEKTVNQHRMANCYYLWDSFYYDKAKNSKKRHKNSWGYNEKHVHNNSIDVLDILSDVSDRNTLFQNEARIIHYAVDRYQNGMRRKESGKLEDAIVRFAQVIEMICNYRVYKLSQGRSFVDIQDTDEKNPISMDIEPNTPWEFGRLIGLLFGTNTVEINHTTYRILKDKRMRANGYGDDYNSSSDIIRVIKPRNDFMHFNNPQRLTEAQEHTRNLSELAHKFLEKFIDDYCGDYFNENGLSLDSLLELHSFRR